MDGLGNMYKQNHNHTTLIGTLTNLVNCFHNFRSNFGNLIREVGYVRILERNGEVGYELRVTEKEK